MSYVPKNDLNSNLFTQRICYNTKNNAYYKNGIFNRKYLKSWRKSGMFFFIYIIIFVFICLIYLLMISFL